MKKVMSYLSKFLLVAVFALAGVLIAGNIGIKAAEEDYEVKAVRVSNSKQLKKAINDPEIEEIRFITYARVNITIKANENAKNKVLFVNAPNATITNKAVFSMIGIQGVMNYYENVSGNRINIFYDPSMMHEIKVAKKKTVDYLNIVTWTTIDNRYNCYTLSKGAKINNLQFIFLGADDTVISEYDENKNEVSIKFSDYNNLDRSYRFKLDSSGRITRMISDATFNFDYKFKYNKNGYRILFTGDDDDDKDCKFVTEMKGNYTLKESFTCDNRMYEYEYFFNDDSIAHCPYKVTYVMESSNESENEKWVKTYTYDKKNRVATMHAVYSTGSVTDVEYYYNSKDFPVKDVYTYYNEKGEQVGDTVTVLWDHNKSGDLIKQTIIEGDEQIVEMYEVDELGNITNIIYPEE